MVRTQNNKSENLNRFFVRSTSSGPYESNGATDCLTSTEDFRFLFCLNYLSTMYSSNFELLSPVMQKSYVIWYTIFSIYDGISGTHPYRKSGQTCILKSNTFMGYLR